MFIELHLNFNKRLLHNLCSTFRASSKTPIPTPKKRRRCVDPVEVSCRLRPLLATDSGQKCVERVSETSLKLIPPVASHGHKNREDMMKAMEQRFYTFHNIFNEIESQKTVFDRLALPLVEDLIRGKNGKSLKITISVII